VFEEIFDKEDFAEDDPDALEDPLMKIDLLVCFVNIKILIIKLLISNFFA
jgi:hypothetical protein